jgi:hypothetical protein
MDALVQFEVRIRSGLDDGRQTAGNCGISEDDLPFALEKTDLPRPQVLYMGNEGLGE